MSHFAVTEITNYSGNAGKRVSAAIEHTGNRASLQKIQRRRDRWTQYSDVNTVLSVAPTVALTLFQRHLQKMAQTRARCMPSTVFAIRQHICCQTRFLANLWTAQMSPVCPGRRVCLAQFHHQMHNYLKSRLRIFQFSQKAFQVQEPSTDQTVTLARRVQIQQCLAYLKYMACQYPLTLRVQLHLYLACWRRMSTHYLT